MDKVPNNGKLATKPKPKPATKPTTKPKPKPAISPPGRVNKGKHGLQDGRLETATGSARLRKLLGLSTDVPIERVCDEAAQEIENLRDK